MKRPSLILLSLLSLALFAAPAPPAPNGSSFLYHTPRNNAQTTVMAPRAAGGHSVTVASASALSTTYPTLVTVVRNNAPLCILEVTGSTGNVLTVSGAVEGTTDAALVARDVLQHRVTALYVVELQGAIDTKAPVVSPALTGTPTAPTPVSSDNSTRLATTGFVATAIAAGGGGAPLNSPAFTGTPRAPTPGPGDSTSLLATTAFVTNAVAGAGGGPSAYVVDVTKNGAAIDGTTDCAPALQTIYDAAAGKTVFLPPLNFKVNVPVFRNTNNTITQGAGENATLVYTPADAEFPVFIDGVPPATPDGTRVTSANRPDAFGILDTSLCNAPATVFGFNSLGRAVPHLTGHGLQIGKWSSVTGRDYYATFTGQTERFIIGPVPANKPLFGFGGDGQSGSGVGAWNYSTDATAANVIRKFRDSGIGAGTYRQFSFPINPAIVNRIISGIDYATKLPFARVNGTLVTCNPATFVGASPALGSSNDKQVRDYPFQIGAWGPYGASGSGTPATAFTLYGLLVKTVADPVDPANDRLRYLDASGANTLAYFDPTVYSQGNPATARLLKFNEGAAGNSKNGYAVIMDSQQSAVGMSRCESRDFSTQGGGVLSGPTLEQRYARCTLAGETRGFSSVTGVTSYPNDFDNVSFKGWDCPFSPYRLIWTGRNLKFFGGGAVGAFRQTDCSGRLDGGFWDGGSKAPDIMIGSFTGAGYANQLIVNNFTGDNEAVSLQVAAIQMDAPQAGLAGFLSLDGVNASQMGGSASFLKLSGAGGAGTLPAVLKTFGLNFSPCLSAIDVTGTDGTWIGSVDVRQTPSNVNKTGSAGSKVVLVTP